MLDKKIFDGIFKRDKRFVSRAISIVESSEVNSVELLKQIHSKTGNAYRIGITGPPGAGKSTITNQLIKLFRKQNKSVGVIAVDPTSPFTGGALLGDRVRMNDSHNDPDVFIRSMATRGSLGGLSKKTIDAADVLDAAGFDYIIFETVGVGQSELDIAQTADSTIVVLVPESGDAIQAMKAGLMEIADFFVMNKSDRPGAENAISALKTILSLKDNHSRDWGIEIVQAVGTENKGISEIADTIQKHKNFLTSTNLLTEKRKSNMKLRIRNIIDEKLRHEIWADDRIDFLNESIGSVISAKVSPYQLSEEIIKKYKLDIAQ